jgi:hypothetical protein
MDKVGEIFPPNKNKFSTKNHVLNLNFVGRIKFRKSFAIDCLEYLKTFYTFREYSFQNIYNRFNRFESRKRSGLYSGLF